MFSVVICDDESYDQEAIANAVHEWKAARDFRDELHCECFASSEDLLAQWDRGMDVDILFLDIMIPGEMDGMRIAQRIRALDMSVAIVFVTNYVSYVFEGYSVNALRFLMKPIRQEDVFTCLNIVRRQKMIERSESILVNTRREKIVLQPGEILYVEASSHYLKLHLTCTDERPEVRAKLDDFLFNLPKSLFVRSHKSYAVNLMHVRRFSQKSIVMSNGDELPISQSQSHALSDAFHEYFSKG